jgi:hypothetical protein
MTPGPAQELTTLFPSDGSAPGAGGGPGPSAPPPSGGSGPSAPTARVLLQDDFSNPNSGWPERASDPTTRRVGYENGEYVVAALGSTSGFPTVFRSERYGNFQVELDARIVSPPLGAVVFLDFRRQDNGDHYSFIVDPSDSTFLLARIMGGSSTRLLDWTAAPAIAGGTARNRLGVRAQGPELVLLVNGQEVGRARDDALREGMVAFGVGNTNDGPAEARFDNLVVTGVE